MNVMLVHLARCIRWGLYYSYFQYLIVNDHRVWCIEWNVNHFAIYCLQVVPNNKTGLALNEHLHVCVYVHICMSVTALLGDYLCRWKCRWFHEFQQISCYHFYKHISTILIKQRQPHLTSLCLGLPGWAGTKKVQTNLDLLEQETVGGSGISWAICKSAPHPRQITTPASHHSVFYRPYALPATQPTASKQNTNK